MTDKNCETMQRANELMYMPRWQLPYACFMYAKYLCGRMGMCGEVLLTAYAHYANYMEERHCGDPAYAADALAKNYFEELLKGRPPE